MSSSFRRFCAAAACLAALSCQAAPLRIDHRQTDITRLTQAQIERATVITADRAFAAYDVPVLWAGQ